MGQIHGPERSIFLAYRSRGEARLVQRGKCCCFHERLEGFHLKVAFKVFTITHLPGQQLHAAEETPNIVMVIVIVEPPLQPTKAEICGQALALLLPTPSSCLRCCDRHFYIFLKNPELGQRLQPEF